MKARLHGAPQECQAAAARLATVLEVLSVSPAYPDRGPSQLVRVYLEVRIPTKEAHDDRL